MKKETKKNNGNSRVKEVLAVMMIIAVVIAVILTITFCSNKNTNDVTPVVTTPTEAETEHLEDVITPNPVADDSTEAMMVKETVVAFLDMFISADIEKIKASVHEDDQWLFNFESESQVRFYETIFPEISYELDFVSEYEGVYGVMTTITSPNMAEVYGSIITDYIDSTTGFSDVPVEDIMANNETRMLEMITSEDVPDRVEKLYIYVEHIDGVYIPRCDAFLANELTGGAPEASDELSGVLYEAVDALSE